MSSPILSASVTPSMTATAAPAGWMSAVVVSDDDDNDSDDDKSQVKKGGSNKGKKGIAFIFLKYAFRF